MSLVNFISNPDLVTINLFLERVAIDSKHLGGFHLVTVVDSEGQFDKRLFDLFQNDLMQAIEFDLGFLLLLKKHFQLAADEFLQTDGLKIGDEKIIRAVCSWSHLVQNPHNFARTMFLKEKRGAVKLRALRETKYICAVAIASVQVIALREFFRQASVLPRF